MIKFTLKKDKSARLYDTMFEKYYKLLCVNAYFLLKDEQLAKDIVQNFFLEIWEKRIYLRLEDDMKGYLFRSVHNRCLNYLRKIEAEKRNHGEYHKSFNGSILNNDTGYPEHKYVELENAISDLPEKRREALQKVYFEGERYQAAADAMGISVNSLKTHLKIGIKDLRKKIK